MRLFRQVTMNDELLKKFPFKRELAMQAYVLEHPEILKLDDNYDDIEIYDDEVPIKGGGKNKNGRIDMVATYLGEYIAIIEFKKEKLEKKDLKQLNRYLAQRKELEQLEIPILSKDQTTNPKWIGILVGTSIDAELENSISNGKLGIYDVPKDVPIAAITIERFRSAETGNVYITTDTYFKSKSSQDTTKYLFNGRNLGKGQLVLAVIKEHVDRNPEIIREQLQKDFPKNLAKTNGVFKPLEEAETIHTETRIKRHFINKGQVIKLGDGEMIAVSSQWGINNIDGFIKRAKELGYEITEAKK